MELSIEEQNLLMCWVKEKLLMEKAPSNWNTPVVTDFYRQRVSLLNTVSSSHDGSLFLHILHEINPEEFSLNEDMFEQLRSFFLARNFEGNVLCERLYLEYELENSKWEVLALCFLVGFLSQPEYCECGRPIEYFYGFFTQRKSLPIVLKLVLELLLKASRKLRLKSCSPVSTQEIGAGKRKRQYFLVQEIEDQYQQLKSLQVQLRELKTENKELKDNQQLINKESESTKENKTIETIHKLETELIQAIQTNKNLQEEINKLKRINEELMDKLDIASFQLENLQILKGKTKKYEKKIDEIKKHQSENALLKEEIARLKAKNTECLEKVKNLDSSLKKSESQKEDLFQKCEELSNENNRFISKLTNLESISKENTELRALISASNKHNIDSSSASSVSIEFLGSQHNEFFKQSVNLSDSFEEDLSSDLLQKSRLQTNYINLQCKYEEETEQLKEELTVAHKTIADLQLKYQQTEKINQKNKPNLIYNQLTETRKQLAKALQELSIKSDEIIQIHQSGFLNAQNALIQSCREIHSIVILIQHNKISRVLTQKDAKALLAALQKNQRLNICELYAKLHEQNIKIAQLEKEKLEVTHK